MMGIIMAVDAFEVAILPNISDHIFPKTQKMVIKQRRTSLVLLSSPSVIGFNLGDLLS